ncbi:MAG: hypothetical protein IPG50_32515 [Myxococcales bacterium]|nr:hypothetical protein [Myxococcales bacterium]
MNNAWDKAKSLADKHATQGSIFVRLQNDGDAVVGVFCGEPYAREVYWDGEKYVEATADGPPPGATAKTPSLRVALNFYVPSEGTMKIVEGGTQWFRDLVNVREKYGLDKWLFEIKRHGKPKDPKTKYTILPEEKIDDALRAKLSHVSAHDLAQMSAGTDEAETSDGPEAHRSRRRPAVRRSAACAPSLGGGHVPPGVPHRARSRSAERSHAGGAPVPPQAGGGAQEQQRREGIRHRPVRGVAVDRGLLHSEAETIFRQLLSKFGAELPDDVRTILGYYQSCRIGFDRARTSSVSGEVPMNERTKYDDLVDVLADALFELLLESIPENDSGEDGDEPKDAA